MIAPPVWLIPPPAANLTFAAFPAVMFCVKVCAPPVCTSMYLPVPVGVTPVVVANVAVLTVCVPTLPRVNASAAR